MAARSSSVPLYKQPHAPEPWPNVPGMAPRPDLSLGRCTTMACPEWWTSRDPGEREAACHACSSCPVLAACREWSLTLPLSDHAIYGGLTQNGRIRERARRRKAAELASFPPEVAARLARLSPGFARDNAMKMRCDHGHLLSGDNVFIRKGPHGQPQRVCLECHRRIAREYIRKRRQREREAASQAQMSQVA
jgi:WhiB family redox-sensing transcriptional regulator